MRNKLKLTAVLMVFTFIGFTVNAQGVLTFEDVMKFEDIKTPKISNKGNWLAYGVWPERGDGYTLVNHTEKSTSYKIDLANNPVISNDENWVAAYKQPTLVEKLKDKKNAPKQGLSLLSLRDGSIAEYDSVKSFKFSENGKWLAITFMQSKEVEDLKHKNKNLGTKLQLMDLSNKDTFILPFVASVQFDSLSNYLAYTVIDTNATNNGLFAYDLNNKTSIAIEAQENGYYTSITWDNQRELLAYTAAALDTSFADSDADLKLWNVKEKSSKTLVSATEVGSEWALRSKNNISISNDGKRLFFGLQDREMVNIVLNEGKKEDKSEVDPYDIEEWVKDRGLDIWHGDDPQVKTQEKVTWNRRKNQQYTAVYHLDSDKWLQLADKNVPTVRISQNKDILLASSNVPYQRETTWDGSYSDWYTVDLNTGQRKEFLERLSGFPQISPKSNFVVYYNNEDWHLYDIKKGEYRNLTENLDNPFADEDHDFPSDVPGYGVAGWLEDDSAVLIYDKYDIWKFETATGQAVNLTNGAGRAEKRIFRIRQFDRNEPIGAKDDLLLTAYHDWNKNFGFYKAQVNKTGVTKLLEEDKKFVILAKAENSDKILYTREAYDEYPNLWVSNNNKFNKTKRISSLHLDLKKKWNWGNAELIDWLSVDGRKIQGVVIKPDNYDPNKKYPVFTYYYRFFTDRLHDFDVPQTNHRPVFAQYVSDGYVVFLPDIRFEVGRPGFAATKSLVPGVQKLVEMGIADENQLGLHGHSWSGYQTAFMITQTDIFAAAIAGAPVGNMTSAYSGIRWESGMARQFQYEKTQSRIGASLVEAPQKYIDNSPVFFADRVNTPLLIMHGDVDGAVPWEQSIELYLSLRRYNKDVVFLQYHGEPHHLTKFPNQLDYAIRMKEYFDYYLRGIGEPEWILKGEPYLGK